MNNGQVWWGRQVITDRCMDGILVLVHWLSPHFLPPCAVYVFLMRFDVLLAPSSSDLSMLSVMHIYIYIYCTAVFHVESVYT
jgi:hypothetical protein